MAVVQLSLEYIHANTVSVGLDFELGLNFHPGIRDPVDGSHEW